MNAYEVLIDDQLVEALRAGLPVQDDRLSARLAAWRDDVRLDESVRDAVVSAASGAATGPAPAVRCDGPESAPANRTDALSPSFPEGSAAGPDDAARSGGGTNPGWQAARDRAVREAADAAAATHRAATRERARLGALEAEALIDTLLCRRCERSIPAGDCACRRYRASQQETRT